VVLIKVPLAADSAHDRIYAVNSQSGNVSIVDTNIPNREIALPIDVGNWPFGIAYDPLHQRIYVANSASDSVSVIDTNTHEAVGAPIVVGGFPHSIAFAP